MTKKNNQMNYNLKVIIKNMAGYKDVRLDRSVYNIGDGCLVFMQMLAKLNNPLKIKFAHSNLSHGLL